MVKFRPMRSNISAVNFKIGSLALSLITDYNKPLLLFSGWLIVHQAVAQVLVWAKAILHFMNSGL